PVERLAFSVLLEHGEVAQLDPFERRETGAATFALATATDGRTIFRGAAVLHLAVFMGAKWAAQRSVLVDRETGAQRADAFADLPLGRGIAFAARPGEAVEHVGHHVGDVAELR